MQRLFFFLFRKQHNKVYRLLSYFQTRLHNETTAIFNWCLALSNKIEELQSVTRSHLRIKQFTFLCVVKYFDLVLL